MRGAEAEVEVEILLGNGWYRGELGFRGAGIDYGEVIAACATLEIRYADGSAQRIVTLAGWAAEASDVIRNSLYNGQTIDARLRTSPAPIPRSSRSTWIARPSSNRPPLRSCAMRPCGRNGSGPHQRETPSSTSARISSAGSASRFVARQGHRSSSGTPKCWRTASSVRAPARGTGDRCLRALRSRRLVRAHPHPSTVSATRRSKDGRARAQS